ncbi:MAG: hypothetical protein QGD94_11665, partial [Planctomycetia bacterium]|nr:hypothetical protein [Planctomycetia bacterium]
MARTPMQAGFAHKIITPPAGTVMSGFSGRDRQHGAEGVHDDLFVRALWLSHGGEAALIVGFEGLSHISEKGAAEFGGTHTSCPQCVLKNRNCNLCNRHVGVANIPCCGQYSLFPTRPRQEIKQGPGVIPFRMLQHT